MPSGFWSGLTLDRDCNGFVLCLWIILQSIVRIQTPDGGTKEAGSVNLACTLSYLLYSIISSSPTSARLPSGCGENMRGDNQLQPLQYGEANWLLPMIPKIHSKHTILHDSILTDRPSWRISINSMNMSTRDKRRTGSGSRQPHNRPLVLGGDAWSTVSAPQC